MSKKPLWMARAAGGGAGGLGVPTFAAAYNPGLVYFDDFCTGCSTSLTASLGGAEWLLEQASATSTAGAGPTQTASVGVFFLNGTTNADRVTLRKNPRVNTGATLVEAAYGALPFVVAARFRLNTIATASFSVGFTTQGTTFVPGFTIAGAYGDVQNGILFTFNGTDLVGQFVNNAAVEASVTLQLAPSGATWYKVQAVVTPGSADYAVQWYLGDSQVGTSSAVGAANSMGFLGVSMELSQTVTANRAGGVDYLYAAQKLASAR